MGTFEFKPVNLDERKSGLLYFSWRPIFEALDGEQAKKLILAFFDYTMSCGHVTPDFSDNQLLSILFAQIKERADLDLETYVANSLKNQISARVRWNKAKGKEPYAELESFDLPADEQRRMLKQFARNYIEMQPHATACDRMHVLSSYADTDTDTDTDTETEVNTETETEVVVDTDASDDPAAPEFTEPTNDDSIDFTFSEKPTKTEVTNYLAKFVFFNDRWGFSAEAQAEKFMKLNDKTHWGWIGKHTPHYMLEKFIFNDYDLRTLRRNYRPPEEKAEEEQESPAKPAAEEDYNYCDIFNTRKKEPYIPPEYNDIPPFI